MTSEHNPNDPAASTDRTRSKRLLFVDDDPYILASMRRLLGSLRPKWEIVTAPHGGEALKKLQSSTFDAIVSDITMPGLDGLALLEIVAETYPGVARILHSSYAQELASQRVREVADCFLPKPSSPEKLLDVLDSLVSPDPTSEEQRGQTAS